jgi:peptide/nickel transport system substrate-binding protein
MPDYSISEMSLAERWELNEDSTVLVYHLRQDLVWSDGEPIDADDVVFSYQLVGREDFGSPYQSFWEELDSVAALDDRRVAFYFKRQHPRMFMHSGMSIMPQHVYGSLPANRDAFASHASIVNPGPETVVSGPFKIGSVRSGEQLELIPNPSSAAGAPKLDRAVFRVIPDDATRVLAIKNGSVDVINPVSLTDARALDQETGIHVRTTGYRYYDFVAWNSARYDKYGGQHVKRALSYAIDRNSIIDGLGLEDYATPAPGPLSPLFPALIDPSVRPDPYLPDSARALLAAVGWSDSDGDATLDRDGEPFALVLVTDASNTRRSSAAEIIQAQLREIGIDVTLRMLDRSAAIDLIFNQNDFDAALFGFSVTLNFDYLTLQFWPVDAPYNITGYTSAALDTLFPKALEAGTPAEAIPYWRAAGVQIAHDRPYAFLWFFTETVGMSDRVSGATIDIYGVYQNLHEWTIDR